jgi:hypothetical protein
VIVTVQPKPVINSFTVASATINEGESTTLSWDITGADSATINNGVGSVDPSSGSHEVSPTTTTTYTLTATNAAGSVTATVSVTVRPTLNQGWNLISLYEQPVDTDIASVLSSISGKYSSVWAFIGNSWKVYDPANPGFSDLTTMEAGMGYWIDMSESATLVIPDSAPSNSINLVRGSNLVGYNSSGSQAIADALASIDGNYLSVWAFIRGSWKVYDPANPGFSDLTTMELGYGYWIDASEACTWTLP